MLLTRGKRVAVAVGVVAIIVAAGAAYACRDRIAEEYWIWRLERGDLDESQAAAAGSCMSPGAVPALLKVIAADYDPSSPMVWCWNCMHGSRWYVASLALEGMGTTATPALHDALRDDDPRICQAASSALTKIEASPRF